MLRMYYLCPVYAIEFALGFLGNLLVVLGYPLCLPEWRSTNVYLYNLAVSDLICMCALPRLSYLYAYNMEDTSPFSCVFNRYVLFVNMYSSVVFMMLVCVDRYQLLCYPFRNHILLRSRVAVYISIFTWVFVNVEICPLLYYTVMDNNRMDGTVCHDFSSLSKTQGLLGYSLALTMVGYIIPLVGLFLCTYKMASILRTAEEAWAVSFRKPVRVIQSAAVMFVVLYLPYHIMRNVRIVSRMSPGLSDCTVIQIEAVYIVTRPMAYAHSVINPVFYVLMTERFQELLLAKLHRWRRVWVSCIQMS